MAAALVQHEGIATFAIKGEDKYDLLPAHRIRDCASPPSLHGRRCRRRLALTLKEKRPAQKRDRRHGRDDHGRHSPAGHGRRRRAQVPGHRGQRRRHQALLRQPLRHRPEHDRRRSSGPPTCCWPARRSSWPATAGAARAWPCGPRPGSRGHRDRGRSRSGPWKPAMDGFAVMPMERGRRRSATSSSPSPATSTSSEASTSPS